MVEGRIMSGYPVTIEHRLCVVLWLNRLTVFVGTMASCEIDQITAELALNPASCYPSFASLLSLLSPPPFERMADLQISPVASTSASPLLAVINPAALSGSAGPSTSACTEEGTSEVAEAGKPDKRRNKTGKRNARPSWSCVNCTRRKVRRVSPISRSLGLTESRRTDPL